VSVKLNSSGGGSVTLAAPSTAGDHTLVLPTDSVQPGLVLVASASFTAQSSVSVDDCFTSEYDNYRIMVHVTGSSASQYINARLRASGVDDSASNYYNQLQEFNSTGSSFSRSTLSDFRVGYSDATYPFGPASFDLMGPGLATKTAYLGMAAYTETAVGTIKARMHNCIHTTAAAYDGLSLIPSAGTFTGSLSIYGYRKA
jgi:hypothetical protein